jgi:hypothetical protein
VCVKDNKPLLSPLALIKPQPHAGFAVAAISRHFEKEMKKEIMETKRK